jgi:monoterpene epsilon-lactone hydrolase
MVQRSAQNETISQRALAAVLRGALNLALKPGFRAGRPIEQQRRWLERVAQLTRVPREAAFTAATVGGVPGEWVSGRGPASPHRVILYLHGGAYCVGSPLTHRALTGNLALAVEARVFVADYRLAPEHPFPAALDDAVAAYEGLLANGHEPSDLVIAGDSAGGGLTAATALRLRELGRPLPSALVLFSPWTDLSLAELGPEPPGEPMITRPWVAECAGFYLRGHDPHDPLASPVFGHLSGLPATLVQVGSDEVLLPDSQRLHARLRDGGVDSTLSVYPGRWHVFQTHAGMLADADLALAEVGRFLGRG